METTKMYHNPVLLHESVDGLAIKEDGVYVDVTFGGGGHSKEILNRLGSEGKLFAFDQDTDALENSLDDERFTLINANFRFITQFLKFYGIRKVDGILADFGVSSHQSIRPKGGFRPVLMPIWICGWTKAVSYRPIRWSMNTSWKTCAGCFFSTETCETPMLGKNLGRASGRSAY